MKRFSPLLIHPLTCLVQSSHQPHYLAMGYRTQVRVSLVSDNWLSQSLYNLPPTMRGQHQAIVTFNHLWLIGPPHTPPHLPHTVHLLNSGQSQAEHLGETTQTSSQVLNCLPELLNLLSILTSTTTSHHPLYYPYQHPFPLNLVLGHTNLFQHLTGSFFCSLSTTQQFPHQLPKLITKDRAVLGPPQPLSTSHWQLLLLSQHYP